MEPALVVGFLIAVFAICVPAAMYNGLVRMRNHCRESWSDVDTELKRRHDLIPNLVETVKGYARHESSLLERVTLARTRAMSAGDSREALSERERELAGALAGVLAVVENYPDLKADGHFKQLMAELVLTEDRIQASRRFFNANVRDYNSRCQTFPSMILARAFGFEEEEFFELSDVRERQTPSVHLET